MKNVLATLTRYKALKAQESALKAELDALKADIIDYMETSGHPDKMTVGQYVVTLTSCTRTGIDEKALRADHPEIASEYEKVTEYDRFTVK